MIKNKVTITIVLTSISYPITIRVSLIWVGYNGTIVLSVINTIIVCICVTNITKTIFIRVQLVRVWYRGTIIL